MDERVDVQLDDVRISCSIDGTEGKPPLIMVHGGACDGSTWDDIVPFFADDFRIYRPDLRGHGKSEWTKEYSVDLLGVDLVGLGDALNLDNATVIGHSLGGQAGLIAAQQQPKWLKRLVVEDTMLRRDPVELSPLEPRPDGATYDWDGLLPPLRQQAENPDPRWWADLPLIIAPTLILAGDFGRLTTALSADAVKIMPDARLKVMDTGHFVHSDKPREFVDEINRFLARHPISDQA